MRTLFAVAVVVAAPSIAIACPPEPAPSLALSASTTGTTLHLTFTNVTEQRIEMPIRVHAGALDYDWLSIEVFEPVYALPDEDHDDRVVLRTLTFTEARMKAVMQTVQIAPGSSHVEAIELGRWLAKQAPLRQGPYELRIRWQYAPAWADSWADTLYTETALYLDAEPRREYVYGCGLAASYERRMHAAAPAIPRGRAPAILVLGILFLAGVVLVRRLGNGGAFGRGMPH